MVLQWEVDTQYNLGDVVVFEGIKYQIIQPHRSQSDWTPPVTPALWSRVPQGYGEDCPQKPQQPDCDTPCAKSWDDHKAPQQVDIPPEEREKHWYDLDDDRKRKLEIGGGLAAGAALLAGGFAMYKHHAKSEEEKKAAAWGAQNWLHEAQARTAAFHQNGPQGPVTWILVQGKQIPQGALAAGEDQGHTYFVSRAFFNGGIHVGKASDWLREGAIIGYSNEEHDINVYEILLCDERAVRWVPCRGRVDVQSLGAQPVEGGHEADGSPLYIAQAEYKGSVLPGKCGPNLDGACIPHDGKERTVEEFRVLCYN